MKSSLARLRPTIETSFSSIRRAMRGPSISHERVPIPIFFRVLDNHDIVLTEVCMSSTYKKD
eukprot:m.147406 g.147406  ORF g.147406 m.147406 type:complete len:62 (+) comp16112_c0_seq1:99-284(+)